MNSTLAQNLLPDPNQIIQNLPKYVQALYSDGILYLSGDEKIATNERKALVMSDIKLIRSNIEELEKILT